MSERSCVGSTRGRALLSAATLAVSAVIMLLASRHAAAQPGIGANAKTLVAVFAHDDDEGSVAPIPTRYAREGVHVYVVLVTDGAQGGAHTSIPRGPELARVRAEEAKCATDALAINAPILLGFPDGALGSYWLTRRSCTG